MEFIINLLVTNLLVIVITLVVFAVYRKTWTHSYWERKGFSYLKPGFFFGNLGSPFARKTHLGLIIQDLYDKLKKKGVKHAGLYSFLGRNYLPLDPNIIKNVMQKDFAYFQDRGFYHNEEDDPMSAHLFAISGPKWRNLRIKLTPTFTSGKMKMMFDILVQCAYDMSDDLQKYNVGQKSIDIKEAAARYTTDVIGSCAFGLDCNSFKDENSEFRKYGSEIFKPYSRLTGLMYAFAFNKPNLARKLGIALFSKDVNNFFINVVKDTVNYRKNNNIKRKDMLQLLIDLQNDTEGSDGKGLTMTEMAAQAFVFFIAGFETSSTTMTFCLYELALNQEIQQKVRDEVNQVLGKHGGDLTYEAIMDMSYMGQVVDETLRKYPPLPFVNRKCVEDYKIPGTNLVIEKGTALFVPIIALQRDSEYFPNPLQFDPDRFSHENKSGIPPFTYIPFGEGPRNCIGMRFGLMQVKVGLAILLKNYVFSLNSKTENPLAIDPYSFILTAKSGVWLDVKSAPTVK